MAEIKSTAAIQEKWGRVTPQRSEDYALGIKSPKRDWAKAAGDSKESHKAAMVQAGQNDSYAKGVAKAGTAKWQAKAILKGPGRFAEGVIVGAADYGAAFRALRRRDQGNNLDASIPSRRHPEPG